VFTPPAILPRNGKVGIDGFACLPAPPSQGRARRQRLHLSTGGQVRYLELTDPVFAWLENGEHAAVTSTITMTELRVPAYRGAREQQADEFYALLTTG
jgi:hypothetical protein